MKLTSLLFAAVVVTLPGCAEREPDQTIVSFVDSIMTANFRPDAPGAVVLAARNGVPLVRKAYGLANVELNVPNKPEYVFPIASITKQFTAVCMLQLVQQGKLSMQDDIRKYLKGYNAHGRTITVEHLLTHTNGIPNISFRPDFAHQAIDEPSDTELLGCVTDEPLLFEPGTDWSYNDFGYTLAARIIEQVSGMKFSDYLEKNVFEPLAMSSSRIGTRERVIPLLVTGYTAGRDTLRRPAEYFHWKWDYGMGDMVSSVDDMLKWDEALYTEKLVQQEMLQKAWTPYVLSDGSAAAYGYGWGISQHEDVKFIWHAGSIEGFCSMAIRIPSTHSYVVILCNDYTRYSSVRSSAAHIALRLAAKSIPTPSAQTLPADALREYAGVYEVRRIGILRTENNTREKMYRYITALDTILSSQEPGGWKIPLVNIGRDLFFMTSTGTYFQFNRDEKGTIVSLERFSTPLQFGPRAVDMKTDRALPKEKALMTLPEDILRSFVGKYNFGSEKSRTVRVEGSRVFLEGRGEIIPETETRFFSMSWCGTIDFTKDSRGAVTGMIITGFGASHGKKVE